ncbi:fumarylacetoacetate hydrolase family protein [Alicyclobacillus tolerans]|uniref:fumarylacetoacetate hydrolase family protein n=1 Tax=Alicyclobacillus tolerans TaxID=90970 RepID=UPI001F205150|nr:fumarylacetoacetate hydrolase family protein [Alicyclobacillus tolerans]MCF8565800.1 fumarylacetoacetate hydrolase family protein [Alicyclobacillus tolerans]
MSAFGTARQVFKSSQDVKKDVRNVFCVGRNYREHAKELGNEVPSRPIIFGKSTHAVIPAQGSVVLPAGKNNIHHELELVLYFDKEYQPGSAVQELVGGLGVGLDLTDRDVQSELKAKGQPWELAKSFKNSAVISDFYIVRNWEELDRMPFSLRIDGRVVQSGQAVDMLFGFQHLTDYVGTYFGLAQGDLLFTGTPEGVGPLSPGQRVELLLAEEVVASFEVK